MRKNRKKSDSYRFNGISEMNRVGIAELQVQIENFKKKLETVNDADAKEWTERWLKRFQQEHAKKERQFEHKRLDTEKRHRK